MWFRNHVGEDGAGGERTVHVLRRLSCGEDAAGGMAFLLQGMGKERARIGSATEGGDGGGRVLTFDKLSAAVRHGGVATAAQTWLRQEASSRRYPHHEAPDNPEGVPHIPSPPSQQPVSLHVAPVCLFLSGGSDSGGGGEW